MKSRDVALPVVQPVAMLRAVRMGHGDYRCSRPWNDVRVCVRVLVGAGGECVCVLSANTRRGTSTVHVQ